ncbi:uncharacterized protein with PIN domain [Bradyrhizobium sp. USDA 4472]
MAVAEDTMVENAPRCEDCRTPTTFRARILDVRKDRYLNVYDCPTCKRLYWKE